MNLKNLSLKNFRNHTNSTFDFSSKTNFLIGDNGQGKTNIIEAISYLCLTKSYFANDDLSVLNFYGDNFQVEGKFISDSKTEYEVRVAYDRNLSEKVFFINKHKVETFSSVIGKYPIVICSPEHTQITSSGPLERRKFVDFVISQYDNGYFQNLITFKKVLKHRNKILLEARVSRYDTTDAIEPWNEQLVKHGSYLMLKRKLFVREFEKFICSAYLQLTNADEVPAIEYQPLLAIEENYSENDIKSIYWKMLRDNEKEEKRIGTTLVGPHRDEFVLRLNGLELRRYASQGQHKTFLVSLKIAEFSYLKERCNEIPILLLDDIFSELDEHRSARLLDFIETLSQTFITTTNPRLFLNSPQSINNHKIFHIKNGFVEENKILAA